MPTPIAPVRGSSTLRYTAQSVPLATAHGARMPLLIVGAEEMRYCTLDPALLPGAPGTLEMPSPTRPPPTAAKFTVPYRPDCWVRLASVSTEEPVPVVELLMRVWFNPLAPAPMRMEPTETVSLPCRAFRRSVPPARVIALEPVGAPTGYSPVLSRTSVPP